MPADTGFPPDFPRRFAQDRGLPTATLDDYLAVLDRLFREAKSKGAVCLKTTKAYERTLRFEDVPKEPGDPDVFCTYVGEGTNVSVAVTTTRNRPQAMAEA